MIREYGIRLKHFETKNVTVVENPDGTVPTYWFIFGPFTYKLPFGICAIYFDLKLPRWNIQI